MAVSNVALTDTFDLWRTRTNQLVVQSNFYEVNLPNYTYANNIGVGANTYANLVGQGANSYMIAVQNGSNTAIGAGANAYANLVGAAANAYMIAVQNGSNTAVGSGANAYTNTLAVAVGQGANAYASAVGQGANNYMIAVQNGSNTAVGAGANAYTDSTVATEAALARSATNLTSGTIPVARVSGNYNLITGLGTILSGTWQGSAIAVDRGGTGQTTIGGIQSALGLGSLAYLSSVGTSNITDNSVNGAKIALGSDATGDVMYFNGTDWVRLPAGASGQVLRTSGTSGAPSWAYKGHTFIKSVSATSATTMVLDSFPIALTNFRQAYLVFVGVSNNEPSTSNGGTPRTLVINGSSIATGVLTTGTLTGIVTFDLLYPVWYGAVTDEVGTSSVAGDTVYSKAQSPITSSTTAITISWSLNTRIFDAGSAYLYGVN